MKSLVFAVLLVLSTPIFAKADTNIILKDEECVQVATAVSKTIAKDSKFDMNTDKHMSQNSKIVSKYILDNNPDFRKEDPLVAFNFLLMACMQAEGKTTIPENV